MVDHLWLIGMMGSGKSAVGKLLATRAGLAFVDTDEEVERRVGCSIAQLWGDRGEAAFRAMEAAAIAELAERPRAVIACGGGAVIDERNVATMRESGFIVWLTADVATLATRVAGTETRPLLADADSTDRLAEILTARRSVYGDAADMTVATDDRDLDDIAAEIEVAWRPS